MASKKRKRDEMEAPDTADSTLERVFPVTLRKNLTKSKLLNTEELRAGFIKNVNAAVINISIMTHEAWMFANTAMLCLIEEEVPLPDLNNGFFNQCLAAVSTVSTNKGRPSGRPSYSCSNSKEKEQISEELWTYLLHCSI